jgi:kynurenine formamidase
MSNDWTPERMRRVFEEVKNWGRWGAEDEAGTLNFITPAKRLQAASAVRHGHAVSCARQLPVRPAIDNPFPALHMMLQGGDDCLIPEVEGLHACTDFIGVAYHGNATSHIDALCHVFVDGKMYNGFEATEVRSTGARRCNIMAAKEGIVSRGILLDIPRLHGRKWLEPSHRITVADLEGAEAKAGVRVGEGDILLVVTGRDARRREQGPLNPMEDGMPGLHQECVPWLHRRGVAVLGGDGASDSAPGSGIPGWPMPIHQCALVAIGIHLLDNLYLDDLAEACAVHRQWDFQFTVAPLRIERGTGSPVNPVALL